MHVPTGEIHQLTKSQEKAFRSELSADEANFDKRLSDTDSKMVALTGKEAKSLMPLQPRQRKNWMRNKPCICGSGKKFKQCCWSKFK